MAKHWWRFLDKGEAHPVVVELERLLDQETTLMRTLREVQAAIAEQETAVAALVRSKWTRQEVLTAQARYAVQLLEEDAKAMQEEF